jgi:hypothetical protein
MCFPEFHSITYRVCARVVSYQQAIGPNMTSLFHVETHLAKRDSMYAKCTAQAVVGEYKASETTFDFIRGSRTLGHVEMTLGGPKAFFGVRNPSLSAGHFGIHAAVYYTQRDPRYPDNPLCEMSGMLTDYNFHDALAADLAATGQAVLCNGAAFGEPEGTEHDPLYPKAELELCAIAGPNSDFSLLLVRDIATKRVLDVGQASITHPEGLVNPPVTSGMFQGLGGNCLRPTSFFDHHVGALLTLQVNPQKQVYEIVIVKGMWSKSMDDQGRLPPGRVIASWPY